MICVICASIRIDHGQTLTHHQTCGTFKNSVDLGCYICNRLWAATTLDDRRNVLALAESESNLSGGVTEVLAYAVQTSSTQNLTGTTSSQEGGMYGYLSGYLLFFALNASSAFPQKMGSVRNSHTLLVLLQPLDGKTRPGFN